MSSLLETVAPPLGRRSLVPVAAGLARAEPLWRALSRHDAAERRPVRVLATDQYEAWVIGWAPGQSLDLHDHGVSGALVAVVDGVLDELVVVGRTRRRHRLRAGSLTWLPPGTVHGIANSSDRPGTAIHVYAPPLITMTHFDTTTGAPTRTERVTSAAPVLPAAAAALLVHPAGA